MSWITVLSTRSAVWEGPRKNLEGTVSNEGLPGSYLGNIFFDKQYPMIGVAYSQNDHYEMGVLAAFTKLAVSVNPDIL